MSEKSTRGPGPRTSGAEDAQRPSGRQPLDLVAAKLTDVGRVRPHNEDYVDYYIPPDPRQLARKGALYLVADGMGGHQAGEVASQGAVELVIGRYYSDTTHDVGTSLVRAFRSANQQIHAQAQSDPSKSGMGTTLVAAVILGRKVYMANVGDSRAYRVNKQGISQITKDHSWVGQQVRAGLLTREQARRHPQRNLVTRALGSKPAVEVDLFEGEISAGDSLLLCSDGLTGRVEDHELAAIIQEHRPQEAARLLVDLANERGGNDNISVLIVSAQEERATVKAPVLAPAKKKAARKSALIPALVGLAAVLVLVVGGLVGMRAIKGFFGRTPTPPTSSAVPTATTTPRAEASLTAGVILATTEPLSPTQEGPPQKVTSTLVPIVPTDTPKLTDTPLAPAATKTPTVTPRPTCPPPTLVGPREEDAGSLHGPVTFEWSYPQGLGEDEAFQVLIWKQGQPHDGAAEFWTETRQTIDLDGVLPERGGTGEYLWSVVVVQRDTERRLSPEAAHWRFRYIGPHLPPAPPSEGPTSEPPPEGPTPEPPP